MAEKLPPLPKEAFDGEKESVELKFPKCSHKNAVIIGSELRCKCGSGWTGSNIDYLLKLFNSR